MGGGILRWRGGWWGRGSGHGSGTPLSWPGPLLLVPAAPPPTNTAPAAPTLPALAPRANTGEGRLSTHIKAIPLISTNGPQKRALSPTSKAGTGTAGCPSRAGACLLQLSLGNHLPSFLLMLLVKAVTSSPRIEEKGHKPILLNGRPPAFPRNPRGRLGKSSIWGPPWWLSGKESACQCRRHRFSPHADGLKVDRSAQCSRAKTAELVAGHCADSL